ncbi:MAG: hypothetical protein ACRDAX_00120, partial [Propionibacteriaceae bacterium]
GDARGPLFTKNFFSKQNPAAAAEGPVCPPVPRAACGVETLDDRLHVRPDRSVCFRTDTMMYFQATMEFSLIKLALEIYASKNQTLIWPQIKLCVCCLHVCCVFILIYWVT